LPAGRRPDMSIPVEGLAQQLGGQLERESGSQGTTVCLILPSLEGS
jgi:hypothetical protein